MRVAVIVRPRQAAPPELVPELFERMVEWRERHRSKMEVFEFFVGGGGFAIVECADEAEVNQFVIEFPFLMFADVEARPCVRGDEALEQWRATLAAAAERA